MPNLPQGLNFADGTTPIPPFPVGTPGVDVVMGTPDPPGRIAIYANPSAPDENQLIQEEDNSPEIERAEQCTVSHSQIIPLPTAYSLLAALGRGTFVQDSALNFFRILSSKVTRLGKIKPGFARLVTVSESISFDTPPDDFGITKNELGVNILKNPRYFFAIYPTSNNTTFGINDFVETVGTGDSTATVAQVKMAVIRAIQTYQDAPFFPSSNTINGKVQNNIIQVFLSGIIPVQVNGSTNTVTITGGSAAGQAACQLAIAAGGEIIQNIWLQEDTPYVPGFEMHWTQYFFQTQFLNPGCYVENPFLVVPDYFTNPTNNQQVVPNTGNPGSEEPSSPGSPTIFDLFPIINPQYFSNTGLRTGAFNFSALRLPDAVEYQRTWFKIDHSWLIAPVGNWNPLIFSQQERPSRPSDYLPLQ